MSTLADEFLADLGEEENSENENENGNNDSQLENLETPDEMEIEALKHKSVKDFSKLHQDPKLKSILEAITRFSLNQNNKEDNEYELIMDANNMTVEIGHEILIIHKFIKENYKKKFPELDQAVLNAVDYARVVKRIGNEVDLTKIDLTDLLPPSTLLVVQVTASTVFGNPLHPNELDSIIEACDITFELDNARRKIVEFVESHMTKIAPNLTAMLGSNIAAKLMSICGGLVNLSKMPSGNVQLLGANQNRKSLSGFSSAAIRTNAGFIYDCDVIQKTPQGFRTKAVRQLAGKCTLAARVDAFQEDPSGAVGEKFREDVQSRIDKWLEPPPLKMPKPLVAPDDKPKHRRGGRRARAIKRKYEVTEMRKEANRVQFGVEAQDEFRGTGKTLGRLGQMTGKLRLNAVDKGNLKKQTKGKATPGGASTIGSASGLSSSLAFTPVQGLELNNPEAQAQKIQEANEKYFGTTSIFNLKKRKV